MFYTDVKSYPSIMYFYNSIQEMRSLSDDPLRDLRVHFSQFEKPQIYRKLKGRYFQCNLD